MYEQSRLNAFKIIQLFYIHNFEREILISCSDAVLLDLLSPVLLRIYVEAENFFSPYTIYGIGRFVSIECEKEGKFVAGGLHIQ